MQRLIKKNIWYLAVIGLFGFAVYSNSFDSSFHFDDYSFIVNNKAIREIGNVKAVWQAMNVPSRFIGFYTFAVDYYFYKLNPAGYHVTNFLIHFITSCLVYWFVRLLFLTPRFNESWLTGQEKYIAFFAGLIFMLHPVETQAVTYISQRFASLASLFYLASACFYLYGRLAVQKAHKAKAVFIISIAFGLLGMMTKEIVISLPIMIFFLELFLFGRNILGRYKASIGIFLTALLIIPAMFSFKVTQILFAPLVSESHFGDIITLDHYLMTQARVFAVFLRLFFIPLGQNLDYDFALSRSIGEPATLLSVALIAGLIILAFRLRRNYPILTLALAWFFIALLPNLIPRVNVIFEHKMYLASIGLCVGLSAGIHVFIEDKYRWIILSSIVLALSVLTYQRNNVWKNEITLWEDVAQKSPDKPRANLNLGKAYLEIGQYETALRYFHKVLEIDPDNSKAYNNIGLIYFKQNKLTEALRQFDKALSLDKKNVKAYLDRGSLFRAQGRLDLALKDYNEALKINPEYAIVYVNRGNIFAEEKNYQAAIEDYTKAIENMVNYMEAYRNRGNAYKLLGQLGLAIEDYNKAILIDPQSAVTYYHRSLAYYALKDMDHARLDAKTAYRLGFKPPLEYMKMLFEMNNGKRASLY